MDGMSDDAMMCWALPDSSRSRFQICSLATSPQLKFLLHRVFFRLSGVVQPKLWSESSTEHRAMDTTGDDGEVCCDALAATHRHGHGGMWCGLTCAKIPAPDWSGARPQTGQKKQIIAIICQTVEQPNVRSPFLFWSGRTPSVYARPVETSRLASGDRSSSSGSSWSLA